MSMDRSRFVYLPSTFVMAFALHYIYIDLSFCAAIYDTYTASMDNLRLATCMCPKFRPCRAAESIPMKFRDEVVCTL